MPKHKIGLILIVVCLLSGFLRMPAAQAEIIDGLNTVNCGNVDQTSSATIKAPADTYDVYVRLGNQVPAASGQLYVQDGASQKCQLVGGGDLQNNAWVKVGYYQVPPNSDNNLSFQLVSAAGSPLQSFSQPTILLVSQNQPACQPAAECVVTINGMQGIVRAGTAGSTQDTLFVTRAVNPAADKLVKVQYYIDNKLAYTKQTVLPFDQHYLGGGQYDTSIVADYASGQRVIINGHIDHRGAADSLNSYLFAFGYGQKSLLQYAAVISLLLLIFSLIIKITRSLHQRRRWMRDHYADVSNKPTLTSRSKTYLEAKVHPRLLENGDRLVRLTKWFFRILPLIATALVLIVIINSYAIQLDQVDGPSMDSTFTSGNQLVVNKLGQTWAQVSHKGYTPKRGQVVVFRRTLDISNPRSSDGSEFVIKRVIGLPGERVVVSGQTITIYNAAHPQGFQPDSGAVWAKTMHLGDILNTRIDVTLTPDEVFVCGDNRPNSIDSRSFGPIQTKDIVGNVVFHN